MRKRVIGMLLTLAMAVTALGGMVPAAAEGTLLIDDDYSALQAGADIAGLGWSVDETNNNGTIDGTGSSLKVQKGSSATYMTVYKSLEHYDREYAASGSAEETRTAVRSSHLKGIYDISFTAKYADTESGSGTWIDVLGGYPGETAAANDSVGRLRATENGVAVYNNKLNASESALTMYTPGTEYRKVRLRMDTETGLFQVYLDDSTTPAKTTTTVTTGKSDDTFDMTSWNKRADIYYIGSAVRFDVQKAANGSMEITDFAVTEVEKDISNVVEQALAALTIDKLTADPAAVTAAVTLPTAVDGVEGLDTITWTSSNSDVISADGQTVVQQEKDTDVILTAKITETETGFTKYKEFKLTVPAQGAAQEGWTQVLDMQLGSGESEYTVTEDSLMDNGNLSITSNAQDYLKVTANKTNSGKDKLVFDVPLKQDGEDVVLGGGDTYYFEVTAVDNVQGQFFTSVCGKKADGVTDGTHSGFVFDKTDPTNGTQISINKRDTDGGAVNYGTPFQYEKGKELKFGYEINTTDGTFYVCKDGKRAGGPYYPSYGGVDIRKLKCEFKGWLQAGDYVQLISLKAWKKTDGGTVTPSGSWEEAMEMQLGGGESEYTVTQAGSGDLEITSTPETHLQVKVKDGAKGRPYQGENSLKFEVPLVKDGQPFVMDPSSYYYLEMTAVDGLTDGQFYASVTGNEANGTPDAVHSAFDFEKGDTMSVTKRDDSATGAVGGVELAAHEKNKEYTFGYLLNTADGTFTVYDGENQYGPYFPSYRGVDIRKLKCEFKNWLKPGDYVQLVSLKAWKWTGTEAPTAPPEEGGTPTPTGTSISTPTPTVTPTATPTATATATPVPTPTPIADAGEIVYEQEFSGATINAETKMADGWQVSQEMQTMTEHTVESGALKATKTAAATSDNSEKITMQLPLKIYEQEYDPATHSAVYTDELFGKYKLELYVKPHITGGQLAAVGMSKKSGGALAKGAAVSLKKSQADVWIATGDTRVVETDGTPNDKWNQIIYTLDTDNTGQWTVQFGDLEPKVLDQEWGGLAGLYLAMKPSNDAGESIMLRSARIYEVEKYERTEDETLDAALAELEIADLTDTPDAVEADLKALPQEAGTLPVNWTSSNTGIISNDGKVMQPVGEDVQVVMTAAVTEGSVNKFKEFYVTVKGITDPDRVLEAAAQQLTLSDLTDEDADDITQSLKTLPLAGAFGTTITWKSSDTSVMLDDGTLVKLGEKSKLPVTMTATLSLGGKTLTKTFDLQIGIDFMGALYTLYETDFTGSEIAANIDQVAGIGKIRQEGGQLLLDRTGTNGGTATTVRIYPSMGDERISVTGEMILEADVHLPESCEKVEFIPYDDSGNRIFTIYSGKAGGGHGYTYVNRDTLDGSAVHTRVESTKSDLTLKIRARFNLDTKRLTLEVDDNDGSGYKTLADNEFIREDATCLSYIEINGVDNTDGGTYPNTGIVEINGLKVTVNKGYVPELIVNSVDYDSAITSLKGFVSGDIPLNTKELPGTKVTWISSKPDIIANDGTMGEITEDVEGIVFTFRLEMADDPTIYVEKVFDPLTAVYLPEGNLAFGQTVSSNVGSKTGCGPANAVDGNVGTNWETSRWSNPQEPALTIDFGQVQVFNQVMLQEAQILDTYPLRGFVIEASVDGKTYTQILSGTTLGQSPQFFQVNQTMARYLRFRVTKKVATSNVGLAEWQVYLTGDGTQNVKADLQVLQYQLGSLMGLTENVDLPESGALYGSKFVYTSSDPSVLANDGTAIRPAQTKSGTLKVEAYAKTGEDASGNPSYSTQVGGEESLPFSVLGVGGGSGGTSSGGGGSRPSGGSSSGVGGGGGVALPTGPSVNSDVGNETGSDTTGSFRDVTRQHWAYNYVETLKSRQVVSGDENGNFNPEAQITREEFLKMLMNALGIAISDIKDITLSDVSSGDWCYPYIAKAMELGITSGISETEFGAGRAITREDMSVLCTRAIDIMGRTLPQAVPEETFTDEMQISSYAKDSVTQMQMAGVIDGYADGTFGPQNNATRAEAAKIICGMMN